MSFDLLIRNAEIHDGEGSVFPGDVGVRNGRIEAIGKLPGNAGRTVDAAGRALAPGFIDIHSHADIAARRDPKQECKILQGVTTQVFTSCGLGCAPVPVPEYETLLGPADRPWTTIEDFLSDLRSSVNTVYLAAHGALRYAVMGMAERPATPKEIDRMRSLVRGARGLSTGPFYRPMRNARPEETAALAREAGGVMSIHMRDYGRGIWKALDETFDICERSGVPVQVSHLQAVRDNQGRSGEILERLDAARARGLDVTGDVYPYDAGSTMLSAVPEQDYEEMDWNRAYLCRDGSVIGTAERARTLTGTFRIHQTSEADVDAFVRWPHCTIGSDGLHVGDHPHPRLWGTFPRILANWGMDRIPQITSRAADRLGLADRGRIREKLAADLVLLSNPRDRATYENPTRPPEGIDLVVVNGRVTAEEGRHTGALAGRLL